MADGRVSLLRRVNAMGDEELRQLLEQYDSHFNTINDQPNHTDQPKPNLNNPAGQVDKSLSDASSQSPSIRVDDPDSPESNVTNTLTTNVTNNLTTNVTNTLTTVTLNEPQSSPSSNHPGIQLPLFLLPLLSVLGVTAFPAGAHKGIDFYDIQGENGYAVCIVASGIKARRFELHQSLKNTITSTELFTEVLNFFAFIDGAVIVLPQLGLGLCDAGRLCGLGQRRANVILNFAIRIIKLLRDDKGVFFIFTPEAMRLGGMEGGEGYKCCVALGGIANTEEECVKGFGFFTEFLFAGAAAGLGLEQSWQNPRIPAPLRHILNDISTNLVRTIDSLAERIRE